MLCNWGEFIPALFAPMYANTWRTTYDLHDDYTNMLKTADWNDESHIYAGPSTGWNGEQRKRIAGNVMWNNAESEKMKTQYSRLARSERYNF